MNFSQKYGWLKPLLKFSMLLIVLRVLYTGEFSYLFLVWNLFLALLPLYFSHKVRHVEGVYSRYAFALLWLLFFPNAAYIVTDLFHLTEGQDIPEWYDLLLLFSTALSGVLMGLISLYNIEKCLRPLIKRRFLRIIRFALLLLCGYGIYLGRYERWNSWDIITAPASLFSDMAYHVGRPLHNLDVWMLTLFFALWMQMLYLFLLKVKIKLARHF